MTTSPSLLGGTYRLIFSGVPGVEIPAILFGCQLRPSQAGMCRHSSLDVRCWADFPLLPASGVLLVATPMSHTPRDSLEAEMSQGFQN